VGGLKCSKRRAKSFPNNHSQIRLLVQVVVQTVPAVAPEESSMALLQKTAEPLLRRTDQPEH